MDGGETSAKPVDAEEDARADGVDEAEDGETGMGAAAPAKKKRKRKKKKSKQAQADAAAGRPHPSISGQPSGASHEPPRVTVM